MQLSQLFSRLNAVCLTQKADEAISSVTADSRRVADGGLFIAVRGFQSDGHRFIPAAIQKGAAAILAEEAPPEDLPENVIWYRTENTRAAMADVAAAWYGDPQKQLKLVGVTGTNGKTTVTHLIRHILEETGHPCGLIGTNGIHIREEYRPSDRTTPDSMELYALLREMADAGCEYAVMEVSSHSLALDRVRGLRYAVAAFTNLTQDHLDFHGDMEHYFEAKCRLFSMCDTAVINLDDPYGVRLSETVTCPKLTFSARRDEADLVAKSVRLLPDQVQAVLVRDNDIARMRLGIPGAFSVANGLTAVACCLGLGMELEEITEALKTAQGVKGRAEIVPTGRDFTVMIDYSHTPDSMDNILRTVRDYCKGRIIGVFGAGGDRDKTKRPKMGKIGSEGCDLCVITSDNPRSEDPMAIIEDILTGVSAKSRCKVIPDRREAIAWAVHNARAGDIVLLMGKGQETYQEIASVKHHLDEREEVAKALSGLQEK